MNSKSAKLKGEFDPIFLKLSFPPPPFNSYFQHLLLWISHYSSFLLLLLFAEKEKATRMQDDVAVSLLIWKCFEKVLFYDKSGVWAHIASDEGAFIYSLNRCLVVLQWVDSQKPQTKKLNLNKNISILLTGFDHYNQCKLRSLVLPYIDLLSVTIIVAIYLLVAIIYFDTRSEVWGTQWGSIH